MVKYIRHIKHYYITETLSYIKGPGFDSLKKSYKCVKKKKKMHLWIGNIFNQLKLWFKCNWWSNALTALNSLNY